jgi:hypothetical protein
MKRLVAVCAYSMTLALAGGQGDVWFSNKIPAQVGGVDTPFFDDRWVRLEGPSYAAQLNAWRFGEGFVPVNCPTPFKTNGYFDGGSVTVPFLAGDGSIWVQVRAWRVDGGATFEQATLAGA